VIAGQVPLNPLEILLSVTDGAGLLPENRRERIGCLMGLAIVIPVVVILLLVSLI